MFFGLLSPNTIEDFHDSLVYNLKGPMKSVYVNNHPYQARPTLVNKNSDETFFILLLLVLISLVEVVTLLWSICSSFCSK